MVERLSESKETLPTQLKKMFQIAFEMFTVGSPTQNEISFG